MRGQQFPSLSMSTLESDAPLVHKTTYRDDALKEICKIPDDVEFLVTAGNVFAWYRFSLEPFDPFKLSVKESYNAIPPPFAHLKPPLPLTGQQLTELLKLLGPNNCLALPWLRIPFRPQQVFTDHEMSANGDISPSHRNFMQECLRNLMSHQNEVQQFLSNHSEWNNPNDNFTTTTTTMPT